MNDQTNLIRQNLKSNIFLVMNTPLKSLMFQICSDKLVESINYIFIPICRCFVVAMPPWQQIQCYKIRSLQVLHAHSQQILTNVGKYTTQKKSLSNIIFIRALKKFLQSFVEIESDHPFDKKDIM